MSYSDEELDKFLLEDYDESKHLENLKHRLQK